MNDPIFIVGNSRSGTTLVARILNRHRDIYILNETHFMEEFEWYGKSMYSISKAYIWKLVNQMLIIQRKNYYRKSEYEEYPRDAKEIISVFQDRGQRNFATLNKVFFEFEAKRHGKKWAGDQTPRHVFYIRELIDWYPEAKFIQMIRNPCAILLSQKKKWKTGLRWGLPRFEVLRTFLNYHPITTSFIWKKAIEAGFMAQKTIPKESMKTLFFERLVENPTGEIQELCDFLQIEFLPDMINVDVEFSANIEDEGYKGVSKSTSERWINELSETELFVVERLASNQMQSLGYSFTGAKPKFLMLMVYILAWPFQLATAFVLNLGRMGNPVNYISKRLSLKVNPAVSNIKHQENEYTIFK